MFLGLLLQLNFNIFYLENCVEIQTEGDVVPLLVAARTGSYAFWDLPRTVRAAPIVEGWGESKDEPLDDTINARIREGGEELSYLLGIEFLTVKGDYEGAGPRPNLKHSQFF